MARPRSSLRAQAVAWLAQREHSELELRRKLARKIRADRTEGGNEACDDDVPDDGAAQVDALIAWLVERGYLNEQRFIASRLHVRGGRHGPRRIEQELARHGLALPAEDAHHLRLGEYDHALALWQRRFGTAPADTRENARQARFLAGRGYSAEVVRRVLREAANRGHAMPADAEPSAEADESALEPSQQPGRRPGRRHDDDAR